MRILILAIVAASLTAVSKTPVHATMAGPAVVGKSVLADNAIVHKTGRRGRRLATGIAIGLGILGIIAASKARARHYDDYEVYDRRMARRCRRWHRRCLNGNDRACFKHEDRC